MATVCTRMRGELLAWVLTNLPVGMSTAPWQQDEHRAAQRGPRGRDDEEGEHYETYRY